MRSYKIYALIDPRTNVPFYVGSTLLPLTYRLSGHLSLLPKRKNKNCVSLRRRKLIEDILATGCRPEIRMLDTCTLSQVNYKEEYYYNFFINKGLDLLQHPSFFIAGGKKRADNGMYEFVLRMPMELGDNIKKIAKKNRRKITDELLIAVEHHAAKNKIK